MKEIYQEDCEAEAFRIFVKTGRKRTPAIRLQGYDGSYQKFVPWRKILSVSSSDITSVQYTLALISAVNLKKWKTMYLDSLMQETVKSLPDCQGVSILNVG